MPRIAIIGALPREVAGAVKGWKQESPRRGVRVFLSEGAVVVCAGMGGSRATLAVEAAVASGGVHTLISAGFAGACDPGLEVGAIFSPGVVIETKTGERITASTGSGVLVSHHGVASPREKARLREAYRADAVDMEAATVGRLAEVHGLEFEVVKVISDEAEFDLGDMSRFTTAEGGLRELAFGLHMACRPARWGQLARLARNSRKAQVALAAELRKRIEEGARRG